MRQFRQPSAQALDGCLFQRTQICRELLRVGIVPFSQFRTQLKEPRQSIWALKSISTLPAHIFRLLIQMLGRETSFERLSRLRSEGGVWKGADQADEKPMSMHRRVPVVTTTKCRRQYARRRHISVALQHVADLIRELFLYTCERKLCETFCRLRIKFRRGILPECRCYPQKYNSRNKNVSH